MLLNLSSTHGLSECSKTVRLSGGSLDCLSPRRYAGRGLGAAPRCTGTSDRPRPPSCPSEVFGLAPFCGWEDAVHRGGSDGECLARRRRSVYRPEFLRSDERRMRHVDLVELVRAEVAECVLSIPASCQPWVYSSTLALESNAQEESTDSTFTPK